jgi:HD-like signal output (HDOD) protein
LISGEAPIPSVRERVRVLVDRIAAKCDLPPLPAVASRAMVLASNPDAELGDVAEVVAADPALAARVLKISRSTIYLRHQPPRTLLEAVLTIGMKALRQVLVAASARSVYRVDHAVAGTLWAHALLTGLAADELSALAGRPRGGADFVAGILHDSGRLILHLADPEHFAALDDGDEAREVEIYGFSHAAVGACLAERWDLEDEILEAILLHHVGGSEIATRLMTADRVARHILSEEPGVLELSQADAPGIDFLSVATEVQNRFRHEQALFD